MRMRGEERRISSQHQQLDDLFGRVLTALDAEGARGAKSDFLLFSTALEAHMVVEEDIYFPALQGLRNDVGDELVSLVDEHARLRREIAEIEACLTRDETDSARRALEDLAREIDQHESKEENLLARISEGPVSSLGHTSLDGGR